MVPKRRFWTIEQTVWRVFRSTFQRAVAQILYSRPWKVLPACGYTTDLLFRLPKSSFGKHSFTFLNDSYCETRCRYSEVFATCCNAPAMFHLKWDTTCPRLTHAGLGKEVYASQTKILERVTKDEMRVLIWATNRCKFTVYLRYECHWGDICHVTWIGFISRNYLCKAHRACPITPIWPRKW